jgi:hypothetical protein
MKLLLCSLALSSALLPPSPPAADSIVFTAAKATTMRKTFDSSLEFELSSARMFLAERELPESRTRAFESSSSQVDSYVVVDEYLDVADGRPRELVRRFEGLQRHRKAHRATPKSPPSDEDETQESKLVGHSLRYAWNEKSGSYDMTWIGDAGDDELLDGLEEDMDLRAFLPDRSPSAVLWTASPS